MKGRGWKSAALVTLVGALVLVVAYALPAPKATVPGALAAPAGKESTSLLAGLGPYAVADVAEMVSPAVVYIEVEYKKPERTSTRTSPFFNDWLWDMWFGTPQVPNQGGTVSQGTGFIINTDGHILTNQHVVDNASEIKEIRVYVEGRDEPYIAKLLGADYELDLAVLQIEPKGKIVTAALGDSDAARVGEFVVAIGNPYGKEFDHTVTIGVLSAKGRRISIPENNRQVRTYSNLMQTDAAINPGNSGGPLLNLRGEVIGINTAVNAAAQGIGFAIPINVAKAVVDDLVNKGKVERGWLGIYYGEVTKEVAEYLGISEVGGIWVSSVVRNSPAAKGGLQPGDVIRSVNGRDIKTEEDFRKATEGMKPGDKFNITVDRMVGKKVQSISVLVVAGERPDDR